MDLIKAKTLLTRLQAMQHSLESNASMSSLERDLILNYLRELYDIYAQTEVKSIPEFKPAESSNALKEPEKEINSKTLEFKFEPEASIGTTIMEHHTVESFKPVIEALPPIAIPDSLHISSQGIETNAPTSSGITNKPNTIPVSILELFDIKKGNELSDKLFELPLRDINRGIGLNDKLEFISTLFGNQKALFDQTISDLNTFKSFEEAKHLLGQGAAVHYKWDHEDRKEKAIEFIRLIRRRYL